MTDDPTPEVDPSDELATEAIKAMFRRQNWHLAGFVAIVLAGLLTLGVIANASRTAAEGSSLSANATFATQVRSACITDLRSAENDAIGDMLEATLRALAANATGDDTLAAEQIAVGLEAADRRTLVADLLEPDVLNQSPPVGCGPPITSADLLPDGGE